MKPLFFGRCLCILFLSLISTYSCAAPLLTQLSLEEKIGQLLMVHFHGEEANEEAQYLIEEMHVGGIIYYNWSNGLHHPQQVAHLSQGLQQLAVNTQHRVPLLIAVDQEGGSVNRLKNGFTCFPSNYGLGQTNQFHWGEECARIIGEELKAVGVSLNLAPVSDVYTNPFNPVIGIRAFSSDPLKVAFWVSSALKGYHEAGVVSALKHFPGHGDSAIDSHEALPVIAKKRDELDSCELLPFRNLASQADAILTAHLLVPSLDPDNCATFSKPIISDLLRKELRFQGVAITDSLAMQGILSQCDSIEEAVLKSFEAGHDMILLGGKQLLDSQNGLEFTVEDVKRVHCFLVEAIRKGRLSEKRVDESVSRIFALKQKARLFDFPFNESNPVDVEVGKSAHRSFAKEVAFRSLRLCKGEAILSSSVPGPFLVIAPECLKSELEHTSWGNLGPHGKIIYFSGLNPNHDAIQVLQEETKQFRVCLFFGHNAWKHSGQQQLFFALRENIALLYALALTGPLDEEVLDASDVLLSTYGTSSCSLQAAFDYLNICRSDLYD